MKRTLKEEQEKILNLMRIQETLNAVEGEPTDVDELRSKGMKIGFSDDPEAVDTDTQREEAIEKVKFAVRQLSYLITDPQELKDVVDGILLDSGEVA